MPEKSPEEIEAMLKKGTTLVDRTADILKPYLEPFDNEGRWLALVGFRTYIDKWLDGAQDPEWVTRTASWWDEVIDSDDMPGGEQKEPANAAP